MAARRTDALHEVTGADTADADANARDTDPGDTDVHTWTLDSGRVDITCADTGRSPGHRTRGRGRVLGQGDLDTAGTGQTSRTTTTVRLHVGQPNRGPVDGACGARQR
jgi:hypothetical protein